MKVQYNNSREEKGLSKGVSKVDREDEHVLIEQAKDGDLEAFETLIINYEKLVYNVIYRLIGNPEDTYDLSQETFIKVYTKINQFDGSSKFSTWLYRIATNTCLDELRRRKRKETFSIDQGIEGESGYIYPEQEDKSENIENKIVEKEKALIIQKALGQVNEKNREALVLRDIQQLSYEEIADILKLSLGTVKSRISRGRQQVKKILMQDKEPFASYFRQKDKKEE